MSADRAKQTAACQLHDRVNMIALPILGGLAFAGLLGWYEPAKVTNMFIMYVVADFLWVWWDPDTLPSMPGIILAHHIITFLLLLFPLCHPEYANFTCWDGLTEINTFFLIARRQVPEHFRLLNGIYWVTFFPFRFIMYPALLVRFWVVLEGFPLWERCAVCLCQLGLCLFNVAMLYFSFARRMKGNKAAPGLCGLGPGGPPHVAAPKKVA